MATEVRFAKLFRFGTFELDLPACELRKNGRRVRLQQQPYRVLAMLVERRGELVTREEFSRQLWPDGVFVDVDHALNKAINKLREVLGDSAAEPRFIETKSRLGYRFIAKIENDVVSANPSGSPTVESTPANALMRTTSFTTQLREASLSPVSVPRSSPVSASARLESRATSAEALAESQVLEREQGLDPSVPARVATEPWFQRYKVPVALAVVLCIALFSLGFAELRPRTLRRSETTKPSKIIIVVLPFENLSGDPSEEYLSDGMTEELSARLGNMNPQRLGVIGRTSAMTYKHSPRTISQIGKELGVAYVLEGSVRRDGNRVRVTAQLVKVSDQAHVWAQDYDRDMHGLLRVEDEVASEIARQVGVTMALRPQNESRHVPNPEAYEAYLLARYYWNKRTPDGWRQGEQYFRRAIEKDPEFAAAYAGLAECWTGRQEAVAAAKKAVELDPNSGEARTALGWVEFFREWDFVAAEDALKTAVQLDPNYAPAHHLYSGVLELSGRLDEAVAEEEQAVRLDPLSLISRVSLAEVLSVAGQNDRAVEQFKQIFAIDPRYPKAHETLGTVYLRKGMYKQAIGEYHASERYGGGKVVGLLGYAYARAGNKEQALRILSELEELEKRSPSGDLSFDLATVEIGLGNRDAALAWLEKDYQQHDDDGPWEAKVDPMFEPLRSDPRFQGLMGRVTFPP